MRLITQKALHAALFPHPYDNTDYRASMSVVSLSPDHRQLIGYWEAPVGEVTIPFGENEEFNLVLEGELEMVSPEGGSFTARPGDIVACGGGEDADVLFRIKSPLKTIFIVYPQTEADAQHVLEMQRNGRE